MTKYLDLTNLSAVELLQEEMETVLAPHLESQKRIQSFFDDHKASFQAAAYALTSVGEATAGISKTLHLDEITASFQKMQSATHALTGVAEAAARISNVLPWQEITESYRQMQQLTDLAKFSFDLPKITPIEPIRFGHLCVEVMEDEEEMIPTLIPDRKLTEEDKEDIALKVVEILEERGLVVAANKKEQPKLLPSPNIREILLVRLEGQRKVRVVVNGDYGRAFLSSLGKYWGFLVRIAEQEHFAHDEELRGILDYFNTNARCSLYTRSGFGLTQVLHIEDGRVVPAVRMEVISEKAYRTRLNKIAT